MSHIEEIQVHIQGFNSKSYTFKCDVALIWMQIMCWLCPLADETTEKHLKALKIRSNLAVR